MGAIYGTLGTDAKPKTVSINTFANNDCTGKIISDNLYGFDKYCFNTAGKSVRDLALHTLNCPHAFAEAYSEKNCKGHFVGDWPSGPIGVTECGHPAPFKSMLLSCGTG